MAALFRKSKSTSSRPGLPSQKDLFLRSLYPGNHVDLVLSVDESADVVEIRASMIHDITRERQLILAQTNPPLLPSQIGAPLEVTFLCRLEDVRGANKQLRTTYNTQLLQVIPNFRISADQIESALVVPLPARLEIASLRMHFRVEPRMEESMRAYWSADSFNNVIDSAIEGFTKQLRREMWMREKHPQRLVRELNDSLRELIEDVYNKTEGIKQAYIKDISEGGAKLIHDRQIKLRPGDIQRLTLLWENELWEVNARIVRSGELMPEHPSRIFTSVQFVNLDKFDRQRLAKLVQQMLRKELAQRAAER